MQQELSSLLNKISILYKNNNFKPLLSLRSHTYTHIHTHTCMSIHLQGVSKKEEIEVIITKREMNKKENVNFLQNNYTYSS